MSENMSVKWNDYQNTVISSFRQMRDDNNFSDVTLVGDDGCEVQAHKLILSSCSSIFQTMLKKSGKSYSFIYMRGVNTDILNAFLDYIYLGETCMSEENLEEFLAFGIDMKVHGIENIDVNPKEPQEFISFNNFNVLDDNFDIVNEMKNEPNSKIDHLMFQCNKGRCSRKFFKENRLQFHIKNKHPDVKKYECILCEHKFFTMKGLNDHQIRKACPKEKYIQCDQCDIKFESDKKLLNHKESKHKQFYICKYCDAKLETYDMYRSHQKSCSNIKRKYMNKKNVEYMPTAYFV